MKTLLLKLSGPMQSWGTRSDFEIRTTDFYPSKSAIIGLIAACMGYRRTEDSKICNLNSIDFAVRLDQVSGLLRDFHTAKSYKPNGEILRTYVTNRYYMEDCVYVVAISHRDEDYLELIAQSLKKPYFQPFLGRRSLPLNADFFIGIEEKNIADSLENLPWQASEWYKEKNKHFSYLDVYADYKLNTNGRQISRRDLVISFNQKSRSFKYRHECQYRVLIVRDIEARRHDAFGAIGE